MSERTPYETRAILKSIIDDVLMAKRIRYEIVAVFEDPQRPGGYYASLKGAEFGDQEIDDIDYLVAGLDLTVTDEVHSLTQKSRIWFIPKKRKDERKHQLLSDRALYDKRTGRYVIETREKEDGRKKKKKD